MGTQGRDGRRHDAVRGAGVAERSLAGVEGTVLKVGRGPRASTNYVKTLLMMEG